MRISKRRRKGDERMSVLCNSTSSHVFQFKFRKILFLSRCVYMCDVRVCSIIHIIVNTIINVISLFFIWRKL